jgi:hypothetical protein
MLFVAEGERTANVRAKGPIETLLADEHRRLEALLAQATTPEGSFDLDRYSEFRAGLLRHIAQEEKILLPALERLQGGRPSALAKRLRLEHGAIAALLVPPPTPAIVATLTAILAAHHPLEEGAGGLYETADRVAAAEAVELVARLRSAPPVRASAYSEGPKVLAAIERALDRAGFRMKD